jgi:hypothetical protein
MLRAHLTKFVVHDTFLTKVVVHDTFFGVKNKEQNENSRDTWLNSLTPTKFVASA